MILYHTFVLHCKGLMYTEYYKQCYQNDNQPHFRFKWWNENFKSVNIFGMTKYKNNSGKGSQFSSIFYFHKNNWKLLEKICVCCLIKGSIPFIIPSHSGYHYINFGTIKHTNRSTPTSIRHFNSPNVWTTYKQLKIIHFLNQFKQMIVESINAICLDIFHWIDMLEKRLIYTLRYLKDIGNTLS